MAEVATARPKRARSPSPPYVDTLASPLEVLLKRRRRTTWTASASGPQVWDEEAEFPGPASSSHNGMSSPLARGSAHDYTYEEAAAGVERRRARQWERLQAPQWTQPASQPPSLQPLPDSSPSRHSRERVISQPQPENATMSTSVRNPHLSSSPVRHQPPSSTPFRADDEWAPEERMREWGDEYASQNSLLYSLHLARENAHHHDPSTTPHSASSVDMGGTPYTSRTPAHSSHLLHPHRTPNLPTPYRHHQRTPLETPGLVSSPGASSPAPYSPFPHAPHASPVAFLAYEQEHVRSSYEEANRLLAELNVQRLQRHSHDDGWMDES